MVRLLSTLILAVALGSLFACGGGQSAPPPSSLLAISVAPSNGTLALGLTRQMTATGVYADGTKRDLTALAAWSSSDTTIATVAVTGIASPRAPGRITVTAAAADMTGSSPLTVTAAQLTRLEIAPAEITLAVGLTTQFTATGLYSDGSRQDLTANVDWNSSNLLLATLSNSSGSRGLATSVAIGSAPISATYQGYSATALVTVTQATLTAIAVTPGNATLALGTQRQYVATGAYSDGSTRDLTTAVTWTSSTASVTVSQTAGAVGLATAAQVGTATLTAAWGTVTGSTPVTVSAAVLVSIGVTPATPTLPLGTVRGFLATGVFSDHSRQDLTARTTWSSSDSAIARPSNNPGLEGTVTAFARGIASISATFNGIVGSTAVTVTTAALQSIGVTPYTAQLSAHATRQFTATGVYTDATTADLTDAVIWSSTNSTVASISNATGSQGVATASSTGTVTLVAGLAGLSGSATLTVPVATLVSIAVTPTTASIAAGTTQSFIATGTYSDQTTRDISTQVNWTSSAPAIASIAGSGLASAVTQGQTTVTATAGTIASTGTMLTVTQATLSSIVVAPSSASIAAGTRQAFTAQGTYSDGTTQDVTTQVTWTSSDPSVATLSNAPPDQGVAHSTSMGSATLTATLGGVAQAAALTVTPATLSSISIAPRVTSLQPNAAKQLNATGVYTDGTTQDLTLAATWNSSTSAATVSNAAGSQGLATAGASSASTDITAIYGGVTSNVVPLRVLPTYLYAVTGSDALYEFSVAADGSLTQIGALTHAFGAAYQVAVDPGNRYAYLTDGSGLLWQFAIAADGTLTALNPASVNAPPSFGITVDPTGRFVYATAPNTPSTLSVYTIGADGTLTATGSSTAGDNAAAVVVDPGARYVYVTNFTGASISQFTMGSDGSLSAGVAQSVGVSPWALAVDPSGAHVYASIRSDGTIAEFAIGAQGALTALSPASVHSGGSSGSAPYSIALDPSGRYAYLANAGENTVGQFQIGSGAAAGQLSPIGAGSVAGGSGAYSVVVDPTGKFLYLGNYGSSTISRYAIAVDGSLGLLTPDLPIAQAPYSITVTH